jgi:hypothetical protein
LEEIRQVLPFPLRGIDSDNGAEFINDHLYRDCPAQEIQFTRGRPYKKDDNAHIEQKNWTHVRKLGGYLRYDTPAAVVALNDLYRHELRLFQNLFLPSVKLRQKERVGARQRRRYDAPRPRSSACRPAPPPIRLPWPTSSPCGPDSIPSSWPRRSTASSSASSLWPRRGARPRRAPPPRHRPRPRP